MERLAPTQEGERRLEREWRAKVQQHERRRTSGSGEGGRRGRGGGERREEQIEGQRGEETGKGLTRRVLGWEDSLGRPCLDVLCACEGGHRPAVSSPLRV